MSITVSPFPAGLGADIGGVDIGQPLSTADRDAIRTAWLDNLVLRFREQPMDDAQHMAFTRQFGDLEFNPGALIARQYGVENYSTGRRATTRPEKTASTGASRSTISGSKPARQRSDAGIRVLRDGAPRLLRMT